jgi:hypothetical protein
MKTNMLWLVYSSSHEDDQLGIPEVVLYESEECLEPCCPCDLYIGSFYKRQTAPKRLSTQPLQMSSTAIPPLRLSGTNATVLF